jgi:hypothetical protein
VAQGSGRAKRSAGLRWRHQEQAEDNPWPFVSINGFTAAAVKTHSRAGASMVLMDGEDLYAVLEGRIPLPEVLHRKRRHASQTGDIYIRVRDF